jgi:hypothetical protein
VAYIFQTGMTETKLLTEYESQAKEVFGNAVLASLIYRRKYYVMPDNG